MFHILNSPGWHAPHVFITTRPTITCERRRLPAHRIKGLTYVLFYDTQAKPLQAKNLSISRARICVRNEVEHYAWKLKIQAPQLGPPHGLNIRICMIGISYIIILRILLYFWVLGPRKDEGFCCHFADSESINPAVVQLSPFQLIPPPVYRSCGTINNNRSQNDYIEEFVLMHKIFKWRIIFYILEVDTCTS